MVSEEERFHNNLLNVLKLIAENLDAIMLTLDEIRVEIKGRGK